MPGLDIVGVIGFLLNIIILLQDPSLNKTGFILYIVFCLFNNPL